MNLKCMGSQEREAKIGEMYSNVFFIYFKEATGIQSFILPATA